MVLIRPTDNYTVPRKNDSFSVFNVFYGYEWGYLNKIGCTVFTLLCSAAKCMHLWFILTLFQLCSCTTSEFVNTRKSQCLQFTLVRGTQCNIFTAHHSGVETKTVLIVYHTLVKKDEYIRNTTGHRNVIVCNFKVFCVSTYFHWWAKYLSVILILLVYGVDEDNAGCIGTNTV